MIALPIPERMTHEDYFRFEKSSEVKHDYVDGYLVPIAGHSRNHNEVLFNVAGKLRSHLKGKPCKAFGGSIQVQIQIPSGSNLVYYPDVVVDCGQAKGSSHQAAEPRLILEVLSGSNADKDRVEKYFAYQSIPTLQEYVILSQDPEDRFALIYRRSSDWKPQPGDELVGSGTLQLRSIDLELDLAALYDFD